MDIEESVLIQKYEMLLYNKESIYFDITEFEIIVTHYVYEEKYIDALEALVHAELCHPEQTELGILRVKLLICMEEYEKATDLIGKLEEQLPDFYELNICQGQIYLEYSDINKAVAQFKTALKKYNDLMLEPNFDEEEDSELESELESEVYNIPDYLIEHEYYKEALFFLHQFIDKGVTNAGIFYLTACCYENMQDLEKAELYYEKSLDEDPFDEKTWVNLGILCMNNNKLHKSLEAFEFAITINENNYSAILCKANVFIKLGKYAEAIETMLYLTNQFPENANISYCFGVCYEHMGDTREAEKYYLRAIELDPQMALSYCGLAKIMYNRKNFETAISLLSTAMEAEPYNEECIYFRGLCLINLINNKDAFDSIVNNLEIIKKYPLNDDFINIHKKAVFFYNAGDLERACNYLLESMALNNNALDMFFNVLPLAKNDAYIINYIGKYLK
ncbi:MAG: tetratricopeptide repeat protein [Prevotellaceae bacterium]|jgi:tetratricopeptide (TPR) repeat protein|nr:tetratricopeptide repeat protein [Prevotellaceae bacterium]